MDNGPARNASHAQQLQIAGEELGDMFEISTIRKEDIAFHRGEFVQTYYFPFVLLVVMNVCWFVVSSCNYYHFGNEFRNSLPTCAEILYSHEPVQSISHHHIVPLSLFFFFFLKIH